MTVTVEFYRLTADGDERVGRLVWDGKVIKAQPQTQALLSVLEEPVEIYEGERLVEIDPKLEPEVFLRSLYLKYKSAYFRATKASEEEE